MFGRSKYRNRKTDGYDSKKEANRAYELRILAQTGHIAHLREQVPFVLQEKFKRDDKHFLAITYKADFVYEKDGRTVVEDVKGYKTEVYNIKKKLFLHRYPDLVFLET